MISRSRIIPLMIGAAALSIDAAQSAPSAGDAPPGRGSATLRVLILSGRNGPEWRARSRAFREILEDSGPHEVRICEALVGMDARLLREFDVLIDDVGASAPGVETEDAIAAYVESGRGLVVTRGSLDTPGNKPREHDGEPLWPVIPQESPVSAVAPLRLRIQRPDHPILRGMPGELLFADAIRCGLKVLPGAEVLAEAQQPGQATARGQGDAILVATRHGKGRVVCTVLGHDLAAMQEPAFVGCFTRAVEWAATGQVAPPAAPGPAETDAAATRALVITGGHDHETSFYSLFEGHRDLPRVAVSTSAMAFEKDLAGKHDVIVMYDFTRDLDPNGRTHLRSFIEGGGGIVVLHHALLNYQDWSWWTDEVVGGSYRLRKEGDRPSSTYKDRQSMFVRPEAEHPVTRGIGPFHVVDESYRRMRISPRVRPLLSTDHPESDRLLAWIGPNERYRVVAIQLGHGPAVFGHPAYRSLVHNAMRWAARRLR
ncbi:MAG: ThuA domain-containing protein [Isosphaeraceae bacterium]